MGEIRHMSEARRRKKRTSARPAPAKKRRPAVRYFDYSMLAVLVFLVCVCVGLFVFCSFGVSGVFWTDHAVQQQFI